MGMVGTQSMSLDHVIGTLKSAVAGPIGNIVQRALQEGSAGAAGTVKEMYGEFIDLLRAEQIVRKSGIASLPMPAGNVSMTRQRSSGTASYTGEGIIVTQANPTFEKVRIFSKEIASECVVSNSWLRHAGPEYDVKLRDDLVAVMGLRSDLAFIRGDGTLYTPTGILTWTAAGGKFNSNGTTTENIIADIEHARYLIRTANVPVEKLVWYMSPRSEKGLRKARDGNGNYYYRDDMNDGHIDNVPYYVTTQIPENLGGAGNKSEVYLVATSEHQIYDDLDVNIQVVPGGAYETSAGTASGLSRSETVIRLEAAHDFFQQHDRAAAIIQDVAWS
jgi:HK97 family phage major capsid protein